MNYYEGVFAWYFGRYFGLLRVCPVLCACIVLSQVAIFFDRVILAEPTLKRDIHKLCNFAPSITCPASSPGFSVFGMYADRGNELVNIGASICFAMIMSSCFSTVMPGSLKDFTTLSFLKSSNFSDPGSSLFVEWLNLEHTRPLTSAACQCIPSKKLNHTRSFLLFDFTRNKSS